MHLDTYEEGGVRHPPWTGGDDGQHGLIRIYTSSGRPKILDDLVGKGSECGDLRQVATYWTVPSW